MKHTHKKPSQISQLAFIAVSSICFYALFRETPFTLPEEYPELDKLAHTTLFVLLSICTLWLINNIVNGLAIAALISIFAGASEWVQSVWLPLRDFSYEDVAANFIGVLLGFCFWRMLNKYKGTHINNPGN
ncbi:MAG: VanZ family protein [Candidatus Polarisedimenticolaceae bacterium]|nr:VanZ family protein [Candidatus Polarisedimenticolaceae bacterium]